MPPDEADIVRVPSAPVVPVGVTKPAETVAMLVLLEVQTAMVVMSTEPLQVAAVAVICWLVVPPLLSVKLVGLSVIDWMQPTVTVTVCVAVMAGFTFAVAVTVAVPTLTAVTSPELLMVAVDEGLTVQATEGEPVLPSL